MMRYFMVSGLCVIMFVGMLYGQADDVGAYLRFGFGNAWGREINLATGTATLEADEIGSSLSFIGGIGWAFTTCLRAEVELTYHPDFAVDEKFSAQGLELKTDAEISSANMMLNGAYIYTGFKVHPFVKAGIGFSQNKLFDIRNFIASGEYAGQGVVGYGDEVISFAWQIMGGLEFPLKDYLTLDIGYRYRDLGDVKTLANTAIGVSTPAVKGDLRSLEVTTSLIIHF